MPTPRSTATFDQLYKKLNSRQKEAVDAILGPVMVIAGPGTGKTQILSLRIANILQKTDTSPDSILALTFTESAAHAMRRRLVDIIGSTGYRVNISTFHSFCNSVIQDFPDEFPRIIGSTSVSNIQQINIVEKIITDSGVGGEKFDLLKPFGDPFYYVRPALGMIQKLKRENISPEHFVAAIRDDEKMLAGLDPKGKKTLIAEIEKRIAKNKELARVYELYEKALRDRRLYDYEDMLLEVIRTLETRQDMLNRLGEMHQFILADEHQDANAAQNRVLELLTSFDDNPNLFIVGDEKQAIFRFQGASLENFLYFKKLFPRAKVIGLEKNYRSTQPILDAAHSLIGKNPIQDKSLRIKLTSGNGSAETAPAIIMREFSEERYEHAFTVEDIQRKISGGVKPGDIAVIYRENRDLFPLLAALERTKIPYVVRSDQNVLSEMEIRKLITFFKAMLEPGRDDLVATALYFDFLKLDPIEVHALTEEARKNHRPILTLLGRRDSSPELRAMAANIKRWSSLARNRPVTETFHDITLESGFTAHVMNLPGSSSLILKVDALFREAQTLLDNNPAATLADFNTYIDTLDQYNVLIKAGNAGTLTDAVELMTAHKSKGLEFDHVYILGAADRHWGNKREQHLFRLPENLAALIGGEQSIEDERRLFYVAITRAKKAVYMSYAKRDRAGKERLPSQFIAEIDPAFVTREDVSAREREIASEPEITKRREPSQTPRLLDPAFLRAKFLDQGLSVTALNNYLTCPWRYFFYNLIRLPQPQSRHQIYGIAVHRALKLCFTRVSQGETVTKKMFLKHFEDALANEPLTEADFAVLLERGKRALGGYYDTYHKTWKGESLSEHNIAGVFVDLPEISADAAGGTAIPAAKILLRGTLDKVEYLSGDHVNVVDYKTAEPKSRNELMGNTKNASGDYYRQLIFYKLLLERRDEPGRSPLIMDSADIDFIEPTDRGVYKREHFVIEPAEVDELVETIKKVSAEILTLSFVSQTCGDADCEFCKLREALAL